VEGFHVVQRGVVRGTEDDNLLYLDLGDTIWEEYKYRCTPFINLKTP